MELRKSFESLRDKGGLAVLRNIPVGKTINFYNYATLEVEPADVDPWADDDPCKGCYFNDNPILLKSLRQCAVWKYCTSAHRSDRTSIKFRTHAK